MKALLPLFIAVSALAVTGCSKKQENAETTAPDPNEVLIEVNGKTLIRSEAMRQVDVRLGGPPPEDLTQQRIDIIRTRVLSQVVDQFVKKTLLLEEADKLNIAASDEEIEKGLTLIKSRTKKGEEPTGIMKDGPAGSDSLRNEIITGIRIDKLTAIKFPAEEPSDSDINDFIAKNKAKLTLPDKGLMPRDKIIMIMKNQRRKKELFYYVKELQEKAEIKHASDILPPIYPKQK